MRRDATARDPPDRGDARDSGRAVDQHRAAPALALRAAAVLRRAGADVVAQRLEERAGRRRAPRRACPSTSSSTARDSPSHYDRLRRSAFGIRCSCPARSAGAPQPQVHVPRLGLPGCLVRPMPSGDRAAARCWPVVPAWSPPGCSPPAVATPRVASTTPTRSRTTAGPSLVAFFDANASIVAGSPQRLTFGVGDDNGALVADSPADAPHDGTRRDRQGRRAGADGRSPRRGPPPRVLPAHVHATGPRHLRGGDRDRRPAGDRQLPAGTLDTVRVPGARCDDARPPHPHHRGRPRRRPDLHRRTGLPVARRRPRRRPHARASRSPSSSRPRPTASSRSAGPCSTSCSTPRTPFGDALTSIHVEVYRSAAEVERDPSKAAPRPRGRGA